MDDEKILKILLVEDNKDDLELIERTLRKGNLRFTSQCVDTLQEFREALFRFKPDIVLSDHGMPEFNSFQALNECLQEHADVPFILVTGTVSDDYAISCLKSGVDDYILKSNLSRLPTAVRNAMKRRGLEKLKKEAELTLRRQNEELVKLNRELDNFVYSVSHNLRGPLMSVVGLLNVTRKINKDPELDGLHSMMRSSISKLDDTLKDIIEYSRNSRNTISRDEINWAEILEKSFTGVEYLVPSGQVTRTQLLQTNALFFSDERRIEVILNNLLANAILYRNKKKGIELKIDIQVNTSTESAILVVKDNGNGIKKDVLPNIYTMFYRGTEESQGSGLGLYIVKEIVDKLKGEITITSEAGEGTTVNVIIPNRRKNKSDELPYSPEQEFTAVESNAWPSKKA
jgi:signal transduction histidine kinase